MAIRVLGCSGSMAAGDRTTSFLLDETVLVDAGSGVGDLSLQEMARVDDILVSHSHLDHVLGIPLLADSVMRRRMALGRPPIRVHALVPTLQALEQHLFNGVLWPDFTRLPTPERPALTLHALEIGQRLVLGGRCVEVLPASHSVPAAGFAVFPQADGSGAAWVYSGDTGPNPALWVRLAQLQVGSLVIETAFGDDDRALAEVSGHLHPAGLASELGHLAAGVEVWVTHIKPGELEPVMREVGEQVRTHAVRALRAGQTLTLGVPA
ncbi:MAG: MBL fold metallo-hydrolase [Rubrivivax sp.]